MHLGGVGILPRIGNGVVVVVQLAVCPRRGGPAGEDAAVLGEVLVCVVVEVRLVGHLHGLRHFSTCHVLVKHEVVAVARVVHVQLRLALLHVRGGTGLEGHASLLAIRELGAVAAHGEVFVRFGREGAVRPRAGLARFLPRAVRPLEHLVDLRLRGLVVVPLGDERHVFSHFERVLRVICRHVALGIHGHPVQETALLRVGALVDALGDGDVGVLEQLVGLGFGRGRVCGRLDRHGDVLQPVEEVRPVYGADVVRRRAVHLHPAEVTAQVVGVAVHLVHTEELGVHLLCDPERSHGRIYDFGEIIGLAVRVDRQDVVQMLVGVRRERQVRTPLVQRLKLLDLLVRAHVVLGPVGNLLDPAGGERKSVHVPAAVHEDNLAAALLQLGHAGGTRERAVGAGLLVEVRPARAGIDGGVDLLQVVPQALVDDLLVRVLVIGCLGGAIQYDGLVGMLPQEVLRPAQHLLEVQHLAIVVLAPEHARHSRLAVAQPQIAAVVFRAVVRRPERGGDGERVDNESQIAVTDHRDGIVEDTTAPERKLIVPGMVVVVVAQAQVQDADAGFELIVYVEVLRLGALAEAEGRADGRTHPRVSFLHGAVVRVRDVDLVEVALP